MKYDNIQELAFELQEETERVYKTFQPKIKIKWNDLDELMDGAIDIHVHGAPDSVAVRPLDEAQMAIEAAEYNMGGIVFKCQSSPSIRTALIAQRLVDEWAKANNRKSLKVVGGVVLNNDVGGLNPRAVDTVAGMGGGFIWTPNIDSSFHRQINKKTGGIEVIDGNNKVVPALKEIFEIIAKHNMVLSITHHTTKERFIMIEEARKLGVNKIEIDHPNASVTKMSPQQMKIAADMGAYLGMYCVDFTYPLFDINEFLEVLEVVGPDHIVLGTDVGNWRVPPPAMTYKLFLGRLLEQGISKEDIKKMAQVNPGKLIF